MSRSYHHGQHITLAGSLHCAENCDVEDVVIHSDALPVVEWSDLNCWGCNVYPPTERQNK